MKQAAVARLGRVEDHVLDAVAQAAAKSGAERWEARATERVRNILAVTGAGEISTAALEEAGFGVRVYAHGGYGYAHASEWTEAAARRAVSRALAGARAMRGTAPPVAPLPARVAKLAAPAARHPRDEDESEKLALTRRARERVLELAPGSRASSLYGEEWSRRVYLDSDGSRVEIAPLSVHLDARVVLPGAGAHSGGDSASSSAGLEQFAGSYAPEALAERAVRYAREKEHARPMPAGQARALVDPGLAGVLAHESFGHLSEYDLVACGWSVLRGRLGERLGSAEATILDSGVVEDPRAGGLWIPYDDEGIRAEPITILDRGDFRSYLHNRTTGALAGEASTGNGRALSHAFGPLVRMRNTYFPAGDRTFEEAMEELGDGYLACGSTGGVPRSDGTFTFTALRGYRVERGEIAYPVKGVTLVGSILDLLQRVEARTRDLRVHTTFLGGCGKWQQDYLPVGLGGPHVLLGSVHFGGDQA